MPDIRTRQVFGWIICDCRVVWEDRGGSLEEVRSRLIRLLIIVYSNGPYIGTIVSMMAETKKIQLLE